jgi:hypothetical protein
MNRSVRRIAYLIVLMGLLGCFCRFVLMWSRPIATEFCKGNRAIQLSRMEIKGQGREALIIDESILQYLVQTPKYPALPAGQQLSGGLYYETKILDGDGGSGHFNLLVGNDKKVIVLDYLPSTFSDTTRTYIVLDNSAPSGLRDLIDFLLSETNREQSFRVGTHPRKQ